jgi:hypothetical protein
MSSIRILCFGDSLTEGYSCFGNRFDPYSLTMKRILESKSLAKKQSNTFEIVTDGQSGDLIDGGSFVRRIGKRCLFYPWRKFEYEIR